MRKNKVLFITTKAITQNIFFKEFIKKNPFDLTLGCSDIKNLEFTRKKIQFNFTSKIWKLLNPFLFLFILFKNIKKILNENYKVIIINNPLASFYISYHYYFQTKNNLFCSWISFS